MFDATLPARARPRDAPSCAAEPRFDAAIADAASRFTSAMFEPPSERGRVTMTVHDADTPLFILPRPPHCRHADAEPRQRHLFRCRRFCRLFTDAAYFFWRLLAAAVAPSHAACLLFIVYADGLLH